MIQHCLEEVRRLAQWMTSADEFIRFVTSAAELIVGSYRSGGKVLVCGNGGSAADAQHFAGELVGKYAFERPPLAAVALTTDTSVLTAVGNDLGFEKVFCRQVAALGERGDVLVALSTSGASANVIAAVSQARAIGMKTIGLTGSRGQELKKRVDLCLMVPSNVTPRIQEVHQVAYHLICHIVEEEMFSGAQGRIP